MSENNIQNKFGEEAKQSKILKYKFITKKKNLIFFIILLLILILFVSSIVIYKELENKNTYDEKAQQNYYQENKRKLIEAGVESITPEM